MAKDFITIAYSSWDRCTAKNTNGLLRRDLPKASDLSVYTWEQNNAIAFHHNAKLRKFLGWKSPVEHFLLEGWFDFQAYWPPTIKPDTLGV